MNAVNKRKFIIVLIGATLGVYIVLKFMLPLVVPFIFAYIIAKAIIPFANLLKNKMNISKTIGGTIGLLIIIMVFGSIILYISKNLLYQVQMLIKNLPIYQNIFLDSLNNICNGCDDLFGLKGGVSRQFIDQNMNFIVAQARNNIMPVMTEETIGLITKLVVCVGTILFTLVSVLLIVQDYEELGESYRNFLFYPEIKKVTTKLSEAGYAYLKAQGVLLILIATVTTIGLLLIKNEYALLIGIVVAVVDSFPILGSGMILIPWSVISLMSKNISHAAIIMTVYLICQLLRQFLEPKLIGDKIGLKPIFTIMSMYAGVKIFGILGFILGPFAVIAIRGIITAIFYE